MIIKALILTTLLNSDPAIVVISPIEAVEGSLFNEYDWEWAIEAKRRRGKQDRHRRRGGKGLR